ncbi:MAG: winged helix-turn-helix transcriptional regulator [Chloroflexia bacterium]|nr:winged helix-turn-helix transcriptional regulator [Chloroflexia bacterium]
MAELIEARPPLEVMFETSLALNLLLTTALLPQADQFEGLDEWLRGVQASLPTDLRREVALVTGFPGGRLRFVEAVAARLLKKDGPAQHSFDDLRARLGQLSADDFQQIAWEALRRGAPEGAVDPADLPPERRHVEAYLSSRLLHVDGGEAATLILEPTELQRRFLEVLDYVWSHIYEPAYADCAPLMKRSVTYHRRQSYSPHFSELFLAVTGRILPNEVQLRLDELRQARFVPTCHLGPYVAFFRDGDLLTVFYNCRSSLLEERRDSERVRQLYPILKALADETRLQIMLLLRQREMYAQEIVEQLGLSQPAISRHLKLMVAAGLLQVRPEGGAKYYAPDRQTWQRLLEELGLLI